MIFYVKNIDNLHWVLNVAVNPGYMMAKVKKYSFTDKGLDDVLYGYMYVDPMETLRRDGTIPSPVQDDYSYNRELIFLLNYLL